MADLTTTALRLVELYGPLALLVFTFLETSMLFPFLPSEVVVPAAAALLVSDPPSLLVFVLAATAGGTAGAFVPFSVFGHPRVGEAGWLRDRIAVSDDRIERGRRWFREWGESSVLWGRFLPVLRSVVSIPAGLAGMPAGRFLAYTAVGTLGFYAAVGGLVYYGRQQSLFEAVYATAAERPLLAAAVALALLAGGVLGKRWLRTRGTRK